MSRKFLYIPAFLIILLGIAPLFIDFSEYAAPYLADAQKTIGRTIKTGTIRLQILPSPRIKIYDVFLGNAPDTSESQMAKIKHVEIILSLFDLLRGRIIVKSIDLHSPEVILEKNKNGNPNWEFNISTQEKKEKKETQQKINAGASGFFVRHFNISNATIHYIDQKEKISKSFSNLNIECSSEELLGPYKIHIRTDLNEGRIDISAFTGVLSFEEQTQVDANISLNYQKQKVALNLSGFIDISKQQFAGQFKASSVDSPLVVDLPYQKIDLRKSVDAQGEIQASAEQVSVKNLSINHPVGQIIGSLNYNILNQLLKTDLKFKHQEDIINIQWSTSNFNEFEYYVYSSKYQEILKWVTQKQLKGAIESKGLVKVAGDQLVLKKATVCIGNANTEANVRFNMQTKQISAEAYIKNLQYWGQLFGCELPSVGSTTIDLEVTPAKEDLVISAKMSTGKGNLLFDGNLKIDNLFAKGNLTLVQVNLDDYVINLKSNILLKQTEIDLIIQNIDLRNKSGLDLSAGGKLLIDLSKAKPHVVGSITAHPIQLTSYQGTTAYFVQTLYNPKMTSYRFLQLAANANSRWSSSPIKLPLDLFTMSLQINVPKLTLGGLVFESLQSEISLNANKLAIPFSARMYGGKLNGALLVEAAKNQNINLSAKFDNISIEKIQAAAAHFRQGKAFGQIELKTYGNSQYDWMSKLQGHAQFNIKDGVVKGFDLHRIVNLLKKPSDLLNLKHLQECFSGQGETTFSNASSKFTILNGAASTNDLLVETVDASLKAEGQADLFNWQMRFMGEIIVQNIKNLPPLKFIVKGPLDQPSYSLDLKQIQQLFLQKGAKDIVSKALGKSIPGLDKMIPGIGKKSQDQVPEASNSNENSEEKPVKPEKIVKGLLKGIFG